MKTRKISFAMLIALLTMMISTFFIPIETNAIFDSNFNVNWTNSNTNPTSTTQNGQDTAFGSFITKYKTIITFVSAIASVTMVGVFIVNFTKLGTTSGNPSERQKVITGLIVSGIAAAGLGSVSLVVGIFYGALKNSTTTTGK